MAGKEPFTFVPCRRAEGIAGAIPGAYDEGHSPKDNCLRTFNGQITREERYGGAGNRVPFTGTGRSRFRHLPHGYDPAGNRQHQK